MTKKELIQESLKTWSDDRSPKNMSALLRSLDSTINAVASTYGAAKDSNMKWAIRVHLANDIKNRYDPGKASINTFVYQSMQRVPRLAAQQRNVVHVPESSDADLRRLRDAKLELLDKNEREPSRGEIADRAGLSLSRAKSLDKKFGKPSVATSMFHEETGGVDPAVGSQQSISAIDSAHRDYVLENLDPTNKKIYSWLSQTDPLAKKDIASKLGMSSPAVSRRVKSIEDGLHYA